MRNAKPDHICLDLVGAYPILGNSGLSGCYPQNCYFKSGNILFTGRHRINLLGYESSFANLGRHSHSDSKTATACGSTHWEQQGQALLIASTIFSGVISQSHFSWTLSVDLGGTPQIVMITLLISAPIVATLTIRIRAFRQSFGVTMAFRILGNEHIAAMTFCIYPSLSQMK